MASEMVMAIGDTGRPEPTPVEETVSIGFVPLGKRNMVTPATIAWFAEIHEGHVPTRLIRVERPSKRNGLDHVKVTFQCTRFVRYTLDSGPVYGDTSGCMVRDLDDARHPVFAGLTAAERARIERAVRATEAQA